MRTQVYLWLLGLLGVLVLSARLRAQETALEQQRQERWKYTFNHAIQVQPKTVQVEGVIMDVYNAFTGTQTIYALRDRVGRVELVRIQEDFPLSERAYRVTGRMGKERLRHPKYGRKQVFEATRQELLNPAVPAAFATVGVTPSAKPAPDTGASWMTALGLFCLIFVGGGVWWGVSQWRSWQKALLDREAATVGFLNAVPALPSAPFETPEAWLQPLSGLKTQEPFSFPAVPNLYFGRSPQENAIRLDNPYVSRRHGVLGYRNGEWTLIVFGTNKVSTKLRTAEQGCQTLKPDILHRLPAGAILEIGDLQLQFSAETREAKTIVAPLGTRNG